MPLLAAADAQVSEDKALLERWMKVAQRGKQAAEKVASVTAPDDQTIQIALKEPYAPLLPLLPLQTSAPSSCRPRSTRGRWPNSSAPAPTGPKERQPDQYVQLARFDGYVPDEDEANMYGGRRVAHLDEIRFVPVPNASTRIEGALGGLYHYADTLPVESLPRLEGQAQVAAEYMRAAGFEVDLARAAQRRELVGDLLHPRPDPA